MWNEENVKQKKVKTFMQKEHTTKNTRNWMYVVVVWRVWEEGEKVQHLKLMLDIIFYLKTKLLFKGIIFNICNFLWGKILLSIVFNKENVRVIEWDC